MLQACAEEVFEIAKNLGESAEDFQGEFDRVKAIYTRSVADGRSSGGKLGPYLRTCYLNRADAVEAQRREREREEYLDSPEFQAKLAAEQKAAQANPLADYFTVDEQAILRRVDLGDTKRTPYSVAGGIQSQIHRHINDHVRRMRLPMQEESDRQCDLRHAVLKRALAAVNEYLDQPVRATREQFERAVDAAIAGVDPTMRPLFRTVPQASQVPPER